MMMYASHTNPNLRLCPVCVGTGINPVASYMVCPKCNGEKYIPRRTDGAS